MYSENKTRAPANVPLAVKIPSPMFLGSQVTVPFTGQHSIGEALLCYKGLRSCALDSLPKTMGEYLARNSI